MKILVLAAHPDDEVLGCGGTIARLVQENHHVYIAILGEGLTSRYNSNDEVEPMLLQTLQACSRQVAELLGAETVFNYMLPDNRFDTIPLLEIVKIIERLIDQVAPEVVYTQHGGDLNVDHAITYRATLTATRPLHGCSIRKIYAYEVASSTEWSFQRFSPIFQPNTFVDITKTLDYKIQALQLYENEIRKFPHPRSPEALKVSAQRWGSVVGVSAAEAFELVWEKQ